jgi:hypothetical protein
MASNKDELEFVSVDQDDTSQMDSAYATSSPSEYYGSVWDRFNILSCLTKQSKV